MRLLRKQSTISTNMATIEFVFQCVRNHYIHEKNTTLSFFFFISIASTILNNSQNILTNLSRTVGENVGNKGMYKSTNPTIKKQSTKFKRESTMLYISHTDSLRMRKPHWLCIQRHTKKHKQTLNGRMIITLYSYTHNSYLYELQA